MPYEMPPTASRSQCNLGRSSPVDYLIAGSIRKDDSPLKITIDALNIAKEATYVALGKAALGSSIVRSETHLKTTQGILVTASKSQALLSRLSINRPYISL